MTLLSHSKQFQSFTGKLLYQLNYITSLLFSYCLLLDTTTITVTIFWWPLNPLIANPTKWPNTLKQFVGFCRGIFWVCLAIWWNWRLRFSLQPSILDLKIPEWKTSKANTRLTNLSLTSFSERSSAISS